MTDVVDIFEGVRRAGGGGAASPHNQEVLRIVRLPVVREIAPEEVEEFSRQVILAPAFDAGRRLLPGQAAGAMSYQLYGGAFIPLRVGGGKTLTGMLCADHAYRSGIQRSLLLVPPQVYAQFMQVDVPFYRSWVSLVVRFIGLGDSTPTQRRRAASSGIPGCYVMPYSTLSSPKDSEELLGMIQPKLVILDEAHSVKKPSAARTKRFRRLVEGFSPQVVAMSGSMMSKSVLDYWYILKCCLAKNCPLPLVMSVADAWAQVIDAEVDGGSPVSAATGPIMPLVQWARKHFPAEKIEESTRGFRRAYKLRLHSAPGVVPPSPDDLGVSLMFCNNEVKEPEKSPGWDLLDEHITRIRKEMVTPTGDELEHAIHAYKWLLELASGFYNELYWPSVDHLVQYRRMRPDEAAEALERAKFHHAKQQVFAKFLRKWLERRSTKGLDSPMLVGASIAKHGNEFVRDPDLVEAWRAKEEADFEGRPDRLKKPVYICPFKVDAVVEWAKTHVPKGRGALLFVYHVELGVWLQEKLQAAGVDSLYCPAGPEHNEAISAIGDPNAGGKGDRTVVASIAAHHQGKNLQAFQHMLVVQWPRSPVMAEQMVGRIHRTGQQADDIEIHRMDTTWFDRANMASCLNDAARIHQTTGEQKMLIGVWREIPRIFNSEALRRAGFETEKLTGEQVALLRDKFGQERNEID